MQFSGVPTNAPPRAAQSHFIHQRIGHRGHGLLLPAGKVELLQGVGDLLLEVAARAKLEQ